ncbi:aminodeoxychorismate synthase, component I [Paenibacillus borealis]|uniref:aminodeoxychorismate synthase n=1 Tax=Paenibacillus borealis TaxID=160799 RepID=A0ABX3H378_PAEBO|nr:aminodeoxychorismate synthase component I [Paenibacillus borealis]OMD42328.1 aminodeoxychorismate synthase, component I [Paenibacillus borealis]
MSLLHVVEVKTSLSSFEIYKLFFSGKYSFFLDSGKDPERLGRYSFIGADPFIILKSKGRQIEITELGEKREVAGNPFEVLKELLARFKIRNDTELPFVGGAVGYFAYDLVHHLEKMAVTAIDDLNLPDMIVGLYDGIVVIDHLKNQVHAVSAGLVGSSPDAAKQKANLLKDTIEKGMLPDYTVLNEPYQQNLVDLTSNFTFEGYCEAIERAREYIRIGDIYQMNMTQRFSTLLDQHPLHLYEKLRSMNPAPFASYLEFEDVQVVSSSPERFIQLRNGEIETRPIKGTIPRGQTPEEDEANRNALAQSTKDQAENLMIVDLMRNDIGRVCKFGTVEVPELFVVEEYASVFHLVSTVTGELEEGLDAVDCIMATFPGGSITGAPKIRSMEIIDELEPTCRQLYTGSIGYLGFDGDMDINIVIRTILVKGQQAYYQVGGGIIWDSVPENEYQETLDKGAALKKALQLR